MRNLRPLALLILGGCSTTHSLTYDSPPTAPIKPGASFDIVLQHDFGKDASEDNLKLIRRETVAALLADGVFKNLEPKEPNYRVVVWLREMQDVSGAERVLLAGLAGRNTVVADVKVNDAPGQTVRVFRASGRSAAIPLAGQTSFPDAARVFAAEVARGILGKQVPR